MSLITKAEHRFEGVLFEVDRVNKNISLNQVKSMGAVRRRNDPQELPTDKNVYPNVKFRIDFI